ncbi:cysteine hydrolase family protein [Metallibacterium sp.]|uniref:cysteine hydrolase n=1 Tax=Metallibacterium sp. TaxID=2940281 RepID=UPI002622AD14|nr:cysteine hydrolase family protein [Metallibacterium sp.]
MRNADDLTLVPARTALLMIEFQREWLAPESKLQALMTDRDAFLHSQQRAAALLALARQRGWNVLHVPFRCRNDYRDLAPTPDTLGLRGAIPRAGTWRDGREDFAPGFEPRADELIVSGRLGASAFAASNLDALLRFHGIDTLLLAGYALHVCVESTLRAAHDLGYRAIVVEDACAAFTSAQRAHVLEHVVHHFGASVTVGELEAAPLSQTDTAA